MASDATYIISLPDLPTVGSELWLDTKSNPKSRGSSASLPVLTSIHPNAEDTELLTPVGSKKSSRVSVNKCHICGKECRTAGALNKHLIVHRQERTHICGICQRSFKLHYQLTSHMLTHQTKKTYQCAQRGCHKTYSDKNSLKHHCASRHGLHFMSPSSISCTSNMDIPASNQALSKDRSCTSDCHSLSITPPKPVAYPLLKYSSDPGNLFNCCGISYEGLELGCYAEATHLPKVKPLSSMCKKSWTLATASESHELEESPEVQTITHFAPGLESVLYAVQENPVISQNDGVNSINVHGMESSLDFSESYPEECNKMASFQPSRKAASSSVGCSFRPPALFRSKQNCPILLKHSLKEPKPQNKLKRRRLLSVFNNSTLNPEPKRDFDCDFPEPVAMSPISSPLPKSRKRKSCSKDSKEVLSKLPTPPLPVPQPTCHKRSRLRSSYLVSPSRVALASFSTAQVNPFFLKDERQKGALGQNRKTNGTNLSPLIMPVSVPVTPDSKPYTDPGEKSQTCKGLYKRSRLDPLNCLIIPIPPPPCPSSPQWIHDQETKGWQRYFATGGYPSQLRSPTYLADQSKSSIFHPPPYTPPPMLSPLRPGNGLYLNTLSQNQPYPPPSSTYNAVCDGKDRISVTIDNTIVNIKPRINVGSRFQAEVPALRDLMYTLYEEHPAQLVCSVAELLDMCCSSALPWGGTNIELALHCLHEVQGNVMAALDLMLMRGDYRTFLHPLNDYHYPGSDHWTLHEIRLFTKALTNHDKDFQQIHNVLQTKSVAQCVEYYYNMKKQKKFKQRGRAAEKKMEVERTLYLKTNSPMSIRTDQLQTAVGQQGQRSEQKPDVKCPLNVVEESTANS